MCSDVSKRRRASCGRTDEANPSAVSRGGIPAPTGGGRPSSAVPEPPPVGAGIPPLETALGFASSVLPQDALLRFDTSLHIHHISGRACVKLRGAGRGHFALAAAPDVRRSVQDPIYLRAEGIGPLSEPAALLRPTGTPVSAPGQTNVCRSESLTAPMPLAAGLRRAPPGRSASPVLSPMRGGNPHYRVESTSGLLPP